MNDRKDPEGKEPADVSPELSGNKPENAEGKPGESRSSGRVGFDARGNPIWEWQLETGVYSRDVTTQRLKKLDLGDLSLADTAKHKKLEVPDPKEKKAPPAKLMPGGGFNPYDSGQPSSGGSPYDNARTVKKIEEPKAAPGRTPADLRKLDEWIKMKKALNQKPPGDDKE